MSSYENKHNILRDYKLGLVISLILSFIPFFIVHLNLLPDMRVFLIYMIMFFASIQLYVQLMFFIHLNTEKKPRLYSQAFVFLLIVLFIIVGGSLWVMHEMHYYMKML